MNRSRHLSRRGLQRGITLIVGMIMLILITLLVLATFHLGKTNLEIVGNVQHRNESLGVAQRLLETAISSPILTTDPGNIINNPCDGIPNSLCFDVNGDGADDIRATLTPTPTCVKAEVIKTANLNLSLEDDRRCTIQVGQTLGIETSSSTDSLCSNSLWDIRAETQDKNADTRTKAVINQGVATRVRTVDVATACP